MASDRFEELLAQAKKLSPEEKRQLIRELDRSEPNPGHAGKTVGQL